MVPLEPLTSLLPSPHLHLQPGLLLPHYQGPRHPLPLGATPRTGMSGPPDTTPPHPTLAADDDLPSAGLALQVGSEARTQVSVLRSSSLGLPSHHLSPDPYR